MHVPEGTRTRSEGEPSAEALGERFTVVVWNVHKEREAVMDELPGLVDAPGLVLLQEGMGPRVGPPLSEEGRATQVVSFHFVRGGAATGVVTWSRAVVSAAEGVRTEAREPVGTPKSSLVSEHPIEGGGSVLVVNVHGINVRRAELLDRQLGALEARVEGHRGPVIVAGDFNTWSRRRRAVVEGFVRRLGLERVFVGEDAPKLDAVFVRGLVVEGAEVVDTRASDHDALVVRVRVAETPGTP